MADDTVLIAFCNPFRPKMFTRVRVPANVNVTSLKEAGRLASRALQILKGKEQFDTFPLTQTGTIALLVLTRSMDEEDAALYDTPSAGMIGALSFARQTLEQLEHGKAIPRKQFEAAIGVFADKYGDMFPKYAIQRLIGLRDETGDLYAKRITRMIELINECTAPEEDEEVTKEVAAEPTALKKSRSRSREREKQKSEDKEEKKKSRSRSKEREKEKPREEGEKKAEAKEETKKSRSRSKEREKEKPKEEKEKKVEEQKEQEKKSEEKKKSRSRSKEREKEKPKEEKKEKKTEEPEKEKKPEEKKEKSKEEEKEKKVEGQKEQEKEKKKPKDDTSRPVDQ